MSKILTIQPTAKVILNWSIWQPACLGQTQRAWFLPDDVVVAGDGNLRILHAEQRINPNPAHDVFGLESDDHFGLGFARVTHWRKKHSTKKCETILGSSSAKSVGLAGIGNDLRRERP